MVGLMCGGGALVAIASRRALVGTGVRGADMGVGRHRTSALGRWDRSEGDVGRRARARALPLDGHAPLAPTSSAGSAGSPAGGLVPLVLCLRVVRPHGRARHPAEPGGLARVRRGTELRCDGSDATPAIADDVSSRVLDGPVPVVRRPGSHGSAGGVTKNRMGRHGPIADRPGVAGLRRTDTARPEPLLHPACCLSVLAVVRLASAMPRVPMLVVVGFFGLAGLLQVPAAHRAVANWLSR